MRLDFTVLWVDDQPQLVDAQIVAITARMRSEGFDFRPIQCTSLQTTEEFLASDVFNDEIDLVLVDWTLGGDVKGQQAIATIRERIPYKDVVFYSASNNANELRRLAFEAGLEGVYCASRTELIEEVTGVFESLVKKVLDLDHTRGIVMGATSDIDQLVVDIMNALRARIGEKDQQSMVADALATIEKRMAEHAIAFETLKKDVTLAGLMKAHAYCTANDRLRILSRVLKLEALKDHAGVRVHVTKYIEEVVPKRNDLGHKILLPDGKTAAIAMTSGAKEMSLDEMRDLRCLILNLRGEFRGLLGSLGK